MKSYHHYHQNFHKYLQSDIAKLEISVWLHSMGRSLIAVFIPMILLVAGFSLKSIMIFLCIFFLIDVPLNFVARKFVLWIGAKNTIIIGIISELIYFIVLYFTNSAESNWLMLIVLATFAAIYDAFYWTAHWFVFNECVVVNKGVGKQIGILEISRQTGALIAPLIGALFLIFANKNYLIIVSALFLALSLIPLARIKFDYMKPKSSMSISKFMANKSNKINFGLMALYAINSEVEETLLPIFIFLTFGGFGYAGVIPTITAITAIISMYYIGKLVDRIDRQKILMMAALIAGFVWLVRMTYPELSLMYISTVVLGFLIYMVGFTLDANVITVGKKTDMLDTSTIRNADHMLIRGLLYLILIFVVEVFKDAFMIAAAAMFLVAIITIVLVIVNYKEKKSVSKIV